MSNYIEDTKDIEQTLSVVKYLIDEIEHELNINTKYRQEVLKAEQFLKDDNNELLFCSRYNINCKVPRFSVIKGNSKKIRELLLKLYISNKRW